MRLIITLLFFFVYNVAALAAEEIPHALYLQWHKQCLSLDLEVIDEQIDKFSSRLKSNPKDYLAKAYLGSAHALRAKASFWGPTKLKHLRLGQKHLDQAVASAPRDPRVRMVRAIGYYKVPKFFQTRATSLSDFQFLLPYATEKTTQKSSALKSNERQAILYYAHKIFLEENQAGSHSLKRLCHEINPQSYYGKQTK